MQSDPACQIDVATYRAMEKRMVAYNAEDSDMHRQLAAMASKHGEALRREEEKGYARGLEASTAALATLDRLGYTYKQGAELWKPPLRIPIEQRHCQNGNEACLAGRRDGVVCPADSCDIDDGVRKA
jgi:hypothetical protein